ncbi:MAG: recombinase family protein [Bacteroidetes bacterium]|nr:recombinase family protein [Bacteroidota bacterium]
MKRKVIIYTRVSTDEQNNGYSPSDQKDKLYKYCEHNNIEIVGFHHDDESGKTFNRPEWLKIVAFIKKNRGYVDNILFLKWDRFSRNVAEAYITIRDLKRLGIEPQAIEQPLDFEIPESKIMLAVYLAAPEVDNDRRALNIFHGIRRGKKEGRWLGARLRGYINTRDENNRPIMAPEGGKQEELVRRAFTEFESGLYNIEELRLKLYKEGLKCNRNSFWMLLKNKGYIGKVLVPAFKEEPAHWVDGIHEGIVSEATYYAVQDIIEGRKKNMPNKFQTVRDEFPLRGFLTCAQCGRALTASSSKGKMGVLYYYYHCNKGCNERFKASLINAKFESVLLSEVKANHQSIKLFGEILKNGFKNRNSTVRVELEKMQKEIGKQKQRLKNAKDMVLDGEITSSDYKEMKYEIEETLEKLTGEESRLISGIENNGHLVNEGLEVIQNIEMYYHSKDTVTKQRIVSSIYPEKLIFDKSGYRTPKTLNVISLLNRFGEASKGNKKGKKSDFSVSSLGVDPEGVEPSSKKGNC